jgi:flagellar basal-body rod protein FlgC
MRVFSSFDISGSGLTAQRLRMDVVANNIANVNTTRTPEGGPYRREVVVFEPRREESQFLLPFSAEARRKQASATGDGVKVVAVTNDGAPARRVYDPGHPDADAQGYVNLPNITLVNEMVDMISATRAYEANITAIDSAKSMAQKALEIGKA